MREKIIKLLDLAFHPSTSQNEANNALFLIKKLCDKQPISIILAQSVDEKALRNELEKIKSKPEWRYDNRGQIVNISI